MLSLVEVRKQKQKKKLLLKKVAFSRLSINFIDTTFGARDIKKRMN